MLEVAIIGAGPAGLAVAKEILTSFPEFRHDRSQTVAKAQNTNNTIGDDDNDEKIALFEESDKVGGLWYRNGGKDRVDYGFLTNSSSSFNEDCLHDAQNNEGDDDNEMIENKGHRGTGRRIAAAVETSSQPIYKELKANLPKDLMSFRDTPFSKKVPMMPKPKDVEEYLQYYARKHQLEPYIYFQSTVIKCEKVQQQQEVVNKEQKEHPWEITTQNTATFSKEKFYAKRLLVCSGHHRKAFVPYIKGLHFFQGKLIHSSAFHSVEKTLSSVSSSSISNGCNNGSSRTSSNSRSNDKKHDASTRNILIVGGGISGSDIAKILMTHNNKKRSTDDRDEKDIAVTISVRNWKLMPHSLLLRPFVKSGSVLPGISHISSDGHVHFCSITGTKTGNSTNLDSNAKITMKPDIIIFATGYRYEYPYLPSSFPCQNESNENENNNKYRTTSTTTSSTASKKFVTSDGYKMQHLYMRMVFVHDPSLVFFNIPTMSLSAFMLIEYQCKWYVQHMKGILQLPPQEEMELEISSRQHDRTQDGLGIIPGFITYCNSLAAMTGDYSFWGQFVQIRLGLFVRSFWSATLSYLWSYCGKKKANNTNRCGNVKNSGTKKAK